MTKIVKATRRDLLKYACSGILLKQLRSQGLPFPGIKLIPAAPSGPAFINWSAWNGAGPGGTTPGLTSTGATILLFGLVADNADSTTATVSDSNGNTWNHLTNYATSPFAQVSIWYAWQHAGGALVVGSGHTLTFSGANSVGGVFAAFSGTLTSGDPYDTPNQNGAGNSGYTGTQQTGSITPSANNALIFTIVGTGTGAGNFPDTIDSGFATPISSASTVYGDNGVCASYLVQGTAATVNPTWANGSGMGHTDAAIAAFKAQ
jgi:hypothetical protein